MKKRIIALALAVMMVLGMSTVAFADETKSTDVTYEVSEVYTWSVPASLTVGGQGAAVEVTNAILGVDRQLTITITAGITDSDNCYMTLVHEDDESVTAKGQVHYQTLTVTEGQVTTLTESATSIVRVDLPQDLSAIAAGFNRAGTYTGTLTFTASVGDKPAENRNV